MITTSLLTHCDVAVDVTCSSSWQSVGRLHQSESLRRRSTDTN